MASAKQNNDFLNEIQTAAAENPEFKAQLLANPKAAIEELTKLKVPDNIEIAVLQDTPELLNIVLPYKSDELSEVELENISGGVIPGGCSNCPCFLRNIH